MTDPFEEDSYCEEPAVLLSKVKAVLKALGITRDRWNTIRNVQATMTESVKILTKIHQQMWKTK